MARVTIDTSVAGPFFGASQKVMREANREWVRDMVREGEAKAEAQLYSGHGVLTGHYKSTIHGTVMSDLHGGIGNDGTKKTAIIGNWLEGSSSRNAQHRFKGYRIWRKTRQHITRLSREFAGKVYKRATRRLT
ncbi:MAG TPA: hypothetical protein VFS30_00610 [Dehalococcoidia bacterium]|nr:hypothetical protein [Dehalococcoidia bacterium]